MSSKKQVHRQLDETELYEYLFQEKWHALIDFLHYEGDRREKDDRLRFVAATIENEFIRKLKEHPADDRNINIVAENFSLLDAGGFYKLTPQNLAVLNEELARRMPKEYYTFSKTYKDEQNVRENRSRQKPERINNENLEKSEIPVKWTEIFNRIFEIMDVRNDAETYFSGPRFINLVRKYDRYHADYSQYIKDRERYGQSTTRKTYFEDILKGLSNFNRKQVIDNILNIIRPYDRERVEQIELLLYGKSSSIEENKKVQKRPSIFISYSWDDESHKSWVLALANKLIADGFDVKIDRQIMRLGSSAPYTMEQAIEKSDKVLVIFTPGYKTKADERKGGVGYEYAILNNKLYNSQTVNRKIIPVLRKGDKESSIPSFMQQYIHIDFRDDNGFETSYSDLKHDLLLKDD